MINMQRQPVESADLKKPKVVLIGIPLNVLDNLDSLTSETQYVDLEKQDKRTILMVKAILQRTKEEIMHRSFSLPFNRINKSYEKIRYINGQIDIITNYLACKSEIIEKDTNSGYFRDLRNTILSVLVSAVAFCGIGYGIMKAMQWLILK